MGQAEIKFDATGALLSCAGQNTLLAGTDYFRSALRSESSRMAAAEQTATERYIAGLPRTAIVAEDKALRSVLNRTYLPAVQQAYGAVVSSTDSEVPHVRLPGSGGSDNHGSVLAGHIADAMLHYVNQTAVQNLMKRPVQLALIGAGNIRAPLVA